MAPLYHGSLPCLSVPFPDHFHTSPGSPPSTSMLHPGSLPCISTKPSRIGRRCTTFCTTARSCVSQCSTLPLACTGASPQLYTQEQCSYLLLHMPARLQAQHHALRPSSLLHILALRLGSFLHISAPSPYPYHIRWHCARHCALACSRVPQPQAWACSGNSLLRDLTPCPGLLQCTLPPLKVAEQSSQAK